MAASQFDSHTLPTILCCLCGIPIPSNPSNMCVTCIRTQVDITDGIPKQLNLNFDRNCGRYLNPPSQWVDAELESRELLSICLKRIKGLNKVKLVDAGFVWTEPHSKRIKVKLTIQKEVFNGTILQQEFIVEFVVVNQMCDACHKSEAKQSWNALVQVRQRVEHKRTFYLLEQLILKHGAHQNVINIKERADGLDFYYGHKSHATKLIDFLQAVAPIKYGVSERLVSADEQSNTANLKYSFSVEMVPICKDDVVCLPVKLANMLGNISPLLVCIKVTSLIWLLDPITLQVASLNTQNFWSHPFRSICHAKHLIEYTILDITPTATANGKFLGADVLCARSSDFGSNDTTFTTRTHLGNILKPGDTALGYDLSTANMNDADLVGLRGRQLPDVVLIRKSWPERRKKNKERHWHLKALDKDVDVEEEFKKGQTDRALHDYELFLREVEEDTDLRSQLNLYKARNAEQILKRHADRKSVV